MSVYRGKIVIKYQKQKKCIDNVLNFIKFDNLAIFNFLLFALKSY